MATRKTHEFHAREMAKQEEEEGKNSILRARRTTLDVYRFRESGWNSPSVNFFTCSRVKGKREKKERRKKKSYFTKESLKLMASIIGSRFFFNFSTDRLVIKNGKYIFIEYLYHSFTRDQYNIIFL